MKKNPNSMFDALVENAADFLEKSISELESEPKYSVIHFAAAIELFLKAALMAEHWTLIVAQASKGKDAGDLLNRFERGATRSITVREAIILNRGVLGVNVAKNAEQAFVKIHEHRNRAVHFHLDYAGDEVIREQFVAWHYLYELLSGAWSKTFNPHRELFESINLKMKKHQGYLDVKFEQIITKLEELRGKGWGRNCCRVCLKEALCIEPSDNVLLDASCMVCGNRQCVLCVVCEKCDSPIWLSDDCEASCPQCETVYNQERVKHIASAKSYSCDEPYEPTNCGNCDGVDSVIWTNCGYLCLICFERSAEAEICEYCNESAIFFDSELSYLRGCPVCDGRL